MFEHSEIKETKRGPAFWFKVAGGILLVLLAYNIYRVNRPELPSASPTPVPVEYTEGEIVNGRTSIGPGEFDSYRADFNHKTTIKGNFRVASPDQRIAFMILDESNFEKWRSGNDFTAATTTGNVPSGHVVRVLEPGTYFLVFNNKASLDRSVVVDTSFTAE